MEKEIIIEANELIDSVVSQLESGSMVLLTGCGDSMKPFIENGEDRVVLEKIPEDKEICVGEIYLYKRANGKYAIHRIFDTQESCVSAVGDAQVSVETDIPKRNLVALVTRVIKKNGTEIDCIDPQNVKNSAIYMLKRIQKHRNNMKIRRIVKLPITLYKKIIFAVEKKKRNKK